MRHLLATASLGMLCAAVLAAPKDEGSAPQTGATEPDPVIKSDPAPAPLSADVVAPAEPKADPEPGAVGTAPEANNNAPVNAAEAKAVSGSRKKIVMVWVQPGHETMAIGALFRTSDTEASTLRAAGRARYASDAEAKLGKEQDLIRDVEGL